MKLINLWVRLILKFLTKKMPATKIFKMNTDAVIKSYMLKVTSIYYFKYTQLNIK